MHPLRSSSVASFPKNPISKRESANIYCFVAGNANPYIEGLTDEKANEICTLSFMELGFLELQIYTMRHVQEHGAQMNLLLGQNGVTGPDWIAQARDI